MKVDAKQMWYAVKNATVYCKQKTWNGGEAAIEIHPSGTINVAASDDFVSVVSTLDIISEPPEKPVTYYIPAKDLKEIEQTLRDEEGTIKVALESGRTTPKEPDWWEGFNDALKDIGQQPRGVIRSAFNPERLALLNRLEPKGEYVLDLLSCVRPDSKDHFWAFRYGPNTYGIIIPLVIERLPEKQKEWLWSL